MAVPGHTAITRGYVMNMMSADAGFYSAPVANRAAITINKAPGHML